VPRDLPCRLPRACGRGSRRQGGPRGAIDWPAGGDLFPKAGICQYAGLGLASPAYALGREAAEQRLAICSRPRGRVHSLVWGGSGVKLDEP